MIRKLKKYIENRRTNKQIKNLKLLGIDFILYASGQLPQVGDIVDVGSENRRYLVTHIGVSNENIKVFSGEYDLPIDFCILKVRYGESV